MPLGGFGVIHVGWPLTLHAQPDVVVITIDRPDDLSKAEEMLREFKLSGLRSLLLDAPDPDPVAAAVGDSKWDGTLPATFVFDSHGKLRKSFIGMTNPSQLEAEVRKVLR